jgi:hypothetical protein
VRGETQVYFKESHRIRWEVIDDNREKRGNTSKFERQREEEEDDDENEEGEYQDGRNKGGLTARRELRLVSTYKKAERGLILINTRGNRLGKMRSNYQPRT